MSKHVVVSCAFFLTTRCAVWRRCQSPSTCRVLLSNSMQRRCTSSRWRKRSNSAGLKQLSRYYRPHAPSHHGTRACQGVAEMGAYQRMLPLYACHFIGTVALFCCTKEAAAAQIKCRSFAAHVHYLLDLVTAVVGFRLKSVMVPAGSAHQDRACCYHPALQCPSHSA